MQLLFAEQKLENRYVDREPLNTGPILMESAGTEPVCLHLLDQQCHPLMQHGIRRQ